MDQRQMLKKITCICSKEELLGLLHLVEMWPCDYSIDGLRYSSRTRAKICPESSRCRKTGSYPNLLANLQNPLRDMVRVTLPRDRDDFRCTPPL